MCALATVVLLLLAQQVFAAGPATQPQWQPIGLSGGGAMFSPAISPADPKLMMLNCDMSGAYISADGGFNWRMIHYSQLHSDTRCCPAFHPTDPNTIFASGGWAHPLKVSHDRGQTFAPIGNLPSKPFAIGIDPGSPQLMLVGTSKEVLRSTDGGKMWSRCEGPHGQAVGFHFDQTSPAGKRVCFAATADGIWRSDDGGVKWAEKTAGLPWKDIRSFTGGSNAKDKSVMLYCAVPSKVENGKLTGGVFRSTDRGETWESAMGDGINVDTRAADPWAMGPVAQYLHVLTTDVRPLTVYALNTNTGVKPPHHAAVFRSDDGGKAWRATFYPDPRFTPCNAQPDYVTVGVKQFFQEQPHGAAICPSNPNWLIHTGNMYCGITDDGGTTWRAGHTRLAGKPAAADREPNWVCNGLVVTTTWNYYLDPFEPKRHYICYTDIGFARSLDSGATWKWWAQEDQPPWTNTTYELAFDPKTPGKIWGAFSNVHDIPNANIIEGRHRDSAPGGVALSTDFGATWKKSNGDLPVAPVTSVVVDPAGPAGSRTLYAGVFGHGVFKSTDDGKSWKKASDGLGAAGNMRVSRVALHSDGTLFAMVTAMRRDGKFQPDGVGLYRSKDGARTWQLVNASHPLLWPKDFAADPADSKIIYIGAADTGRQEKDPAGGLYRTVDGGTSWARLLRKGPEHFGAYLHPKRPGWIYATLTEDAPGAGLWMSKDNGKTWAAMDGLPFANAQRVAFDPADDSIIYVTTFGGSVWRGPAQP
jgi:photosystem II stability/assembly factor-like uncharacterized protein